MLGIRSKISDFNPRSREGSDGVYAFPLFSICYFNPRSREGSDMICPRSVSRCTPISIHAPAKGATSTMSRRLEFSPISIHAPAKGATVVTSNSTYLPSISIHAPAKGATFLRIRPLLPLPFQSTLPRRERRRLQMLSGAHTCDFNPRSREGSDTDLCTWLEP